MLSITPDNNSYLLTHPLSIILDVAEFDAIKFGDWLKNARETLRLSVTELANRAVVSKQYVSMLEKANDQLLTNKPTQPSLDKVERIATVLGADIDDARELAGYPRRNDYNSKPQNVSEFVERLAEMGFDIQLSADYEKLGPDDLQDLLDDIEAKLLLKTSRQRKELVKS